MVGAAGCVESPLSGGSELRTPRVTITDVAEVGHDMRVEVERVAGFTDESPAKIRLLLRNAGDRSREIFSGLIVFFDHFARHTRTDDQLIVAGQEVTHPIDGGPDLGRGLKIPTDPTNGCWKAPSRGGIGDVGWEFQLPPGAAVGGIRVLLNAPGNDECLRPGDYLFDPPPISVDDDDIDPGFTIRIHDADGE